jgi:hypothetical protein
MKAPVRTIIILLSLAVVACGGRSQGSSGPAPGAAPAGTPKVEIAFLNHSPVLNALKDVDDLLASYGDKITVARYDLETDQGAAFARSRKLTGHVPIAIFVDGKMEIKLKDRTVTFFSFPQGKGTMMVAGGTWTAEDLRQAIDQALSRAK